jgi:hypothetical protein
VLLFSKAAELYQPGEAVLPAVAVFQNTPIVASDPKALEILEANPNPVEALNTFLAPFIALLILHIQFDFYILFASIWVGCQTNKSSHSWFYNHFISFNR